MKQNNRYDRYQDDNRPSGNYNRQQQNRTGRNFEDTWNNDPSRYSGQSGSGGRRDAGYDRHEDDYRGGQYRGNEGRENNWNSGEGNSYRSGWNDDNVYGNSKYGQGNQSFNRNYESRNQDWSQGDRNFGRNEDRNYREGNSGNNERGWWDKTSDEVSSWFGDDEAKYRRRMDQINEGRHYGKGPKNYKRSDEKIREDINERLSDDNYLDASDIEVEVNNTEVTLMGTVGSRQDKRRAEDIAERVSGVTNVQNNLKVNTNKEGSIAGSSLNQGGTESSKNTANTTSGTSLSNLKTSKEQHSNN